MEEEYEFTEEDLELLKPLRMRWSAMRIGEQLLTEDSENKDVRE